MILHLFILMSNWVTAIGDDHREGKDKTEKIKNDQIPAFVVAFVIIMLPWVVVRVVKWVASKVQSHVSSSSKNGENVSKTAKVCIIQDFCDCEAKLRDYRERYPHQFNFLGLDCEWVNQKGQATHPVALLQIATPLNDCFLIRLSKMRGGLPTSLKEILEDRNILKFGVGIQDDAKKLSNTYGIIVCGWVDLRHLVLRCQAPKEYSPDCEQIKEQTKMNLGALSKRFLGVMMDKSWRIQCSNWEADWLTDRQVEYAANDAIVAVHLFLTLVEMKRNKKMQLRHDTKPVSDVDIQGKSVIEGTSKTEFSNQAHPVTDQAQGFGTVAEGVDNSPQNMELIGSKFESHDETLDTKGTAMKSHLGSNVRTLNETAIPALFQSSDTRSELPEDYLKRTISLDKYEVDSHKGYVMFPVSLISDETFWQMGVSLCKGIVDVGFKRKLKPAKVNKTDESNSEGCTDMISGRKQKPYRMGHTERKSPMYTKSQLVAPDGQRLCTLDRKKANWYLQKGIGELIAEDPFTVRLKFEPSARPDKDDGYYLTFKENICVVCGKSGSYLRKNVVPHEYRRHFPLCMKHHHSHDIVLMCPECHRFSTYFDEHLRQRLAREYNAPLGNKEVAKLIQDPELMKVRSAAKALANAADKLPQQRYDELVKIVENHYHTTELTPDLLVETATMQIHRKNVNFKSHGEEVVKRVKERGKLLDFEKMWRSHFVETLNPQHLPELWSVNHRFEKMKDALDKLENEDEL